MQYAGEHTINGDGRCEARGQHRARGRGRAGVGDLRAAQRNTGRLHCDCHVVVDRGARRLEVVDVQQKRVHRAPAVTTSQSVSAP